MATFGKTSIGASAQNDGGNIQRGSRYRLFESGSVTKISFYSNVPSGTAKVKCAIYADNAGSPGALKGVTNEVSVTNTVGQWNDYTFASPVSLTAGYYWLVFNNDGLSGLYHQYHGDSFTNGHAYAGSTYPTFSDPFGTASYQNYDTSIYATYTPTSSDTIVLTPSMNGRVFRGAVDEIFTTIRNGAGMTAEVDAGVTGNDLILLRSTATTNQYQYLVRSIFVFDSSVLGSNASIVSATLFFCATGTAPASFNGSTNFDVVAATPNSTTTLIASDYGQLGTTVFATKTQAGWTATNGVYNDFSLDANGISNINKISKSSFGARLAYDTASGSPGWQTSNDTSFYIHFAKDAGYEPKLVITYSKPTGSFLLNMI